MAEGAFTITGALLGMAFFTLFSFLIGKQTWSIIEGWFASILPYMGLIVLYQLVIAYTGNSNIMFATSRDCIQFFGRGFLLWIFSPIMIWAVLKLFPKIEKTFDDNFVDSGMP